jgi:hypothetical protein
MFDRRGRDRARVAASIRAVPPPHGRFLAARGWIPRVATLAFVAAIAAALYACSPTPVATPGATATPVPTTAATAPVTAAPPPTPAGSQAAGTPPCEPADVKASHGLVEGAAGSRLTTVVLVAAAPCSVAAFPALGLRDAAGAILIGAPAAGPGRIDLVAGGVYESTVRLANWCAPDPAFPLSLVLVLDGEEMTVTGSSFPDDGDLPPCNGEGGPILEAGGWVAAP